MPPLHQQTVEDVDLALSHGTRIADLNLWIGPLALCQEAHGIRGVAIVHSCKEPCHRRVLGYSGRGAPEDDPEYLIAERKNPDALYLNLIDPDHADYIPREIMDTAVRWVLRMLREGRPVVIHCDQGKSRAPALALLVLLEKGRYPRPADRALGYAELEAAFKERVYPDFQPGRGVRDYLNLHWGRHAK